MPGKSLERAREKCRSFWNADVQSLVVLIVVRRSCFKAWFHFGYRLESKLQWQRAVCEFEKIFALLSGRAVFGLAVIGTVTSEYQQLLLRHGISDLSSFWSLPLCWLDCSSAKLPVMSGMKAFCVIVLSCAQCARLPGRESCERPVLAIQPSRRAKFCR